MQAGSQLNTSSTLEMIETENKLEILIRQERAGIPMEKERRKNKTKNKSIIVHNVGLEHDSD